MALTKHLSSNDYDKESFMTFVPTLDVVETDQLMSLHMNMPGVEKESISFKIEEGMLKVAGQIRARKKDSVQRTPIGHYNRSFRLSELVDKSKITAKIEEGRLTLTFPKVTEFVSTANHSDHKNITY